MFGPIGRKGVGEVCGLRRHFWYLVFEPTSDASWYSEVHLNRRPRLNSKIGRAFGSLGLFCLGRFLIFKMRKNKEAPFAGLEGKTMILSA